MTFFAKALATVVLCGALSFSTGNDNVPNRNLKGKKKKCKDFFRSPVKEVAGANRKVPDGAGTPGDLFLWHENPLKKYNDKMYGTSSGHCVVVPGAPVALDCSITLMNDDGSIMLRGLIEADPSKAAYLAITGGTECHEGASGTVKFTTNSKEPYAENYYEMGGKGKKKKCKDFFHSPVKEVAGANRKVPDGAGTPGDLFLWYENTLKKYNDKMYGTSSGHCVVVPGAPGALDCSITLMNDDGGIMLRGLIEADPSKASYLAIVGGIKCYEGESGTIKFTTNPDKPFAENYYEIY